MLYRDEKIDQGVITCVLINPPIPFVRKSFFVLQMTFFWAYKWKIYLKNTAVFQT